MKWVRWNLYTVRLEDVNGYPLAHIAFYHNGWLCRVKDGKEERVFGPSFRLRKIQSEVKAWAEAHYR